MNHIILLVLLWIAIGSSIAQDSYREDIKEKMSTQSDKKLYLINLTKTVRQNNQLAVIYNELGLVYQKESKLDSAELCHRNALKYSLKVSKRNQEIAISNNKIGVIYYYRGQTDTAAYYFEQAIPYYTDKKLKANSLTNLAIMNKYNSNSDVAIEHFLSALMIFREVKDTSKQISVYNSIGSLYIRLSEFQKAKKYLNQGLELAQGETFIDGQLYCKSNLATLYHKEKKYDQAISFFKETIQYYTNIKDYKNLIANKTNLASCYSDIGRADEALRMYHEVLEAMETSGFENSKEALLVNIGSCYEDANQYETALKYYRRSYSFAKANKVMLYMEEIYNALSSAHLKSGNADSSIFYKDLQIALHDSLDNIEKEKKMMELESKFQNKELGSSLKQKEEELANSESQRSSISKRLFYSLLIIAVSIGAVILLYVFYTRKKQLTKVLTQRNKKSQENISTLESTLGSKDEEIERLSIQKETGKLPYPEGIEVLTSREKEVLIGVKQGLKDQEIADKLFISIATVRTHLRKAYVKIDVRNRVEAILFISRHHI